jgi:hypothetical protein
MMAVLTINSSSESSSGEIRKQRTVAQQALNVAIDERYDMSGAPIITSAKTTHRYSPEQDKSKDSYAG